MGNYKARKLLLLLVAVSVEGWNLPNRSEKFNFTARSEFPSSEVLRNKSLTPISLEGCDCNYRQYQTIFEGMLLLCVLLLGITFWMCQKLLTYRKKLSSRIQNQDFAANRSGNGKGILTPDNSVVFGCPNCKEAELLLQNLYEEKRKIFSQLNQELDELSKKWNNPNKLYSY